MGERPSVSHGIKNLRIEQRPVLKIGLPKRDNIFKQPITTVVSMQELLENLQSQFPDATI